MSSVLFFSFVDLTTFFIFFIVFLFLFYTMSSPRTSIPGPFALPFVGNLPRFIGMGARKHIEFLKLSRKYGDVFRLYIGPYMLVFICGYKNIHEAFVKHASSFSHRPNWLPAIKERAEKYGYGIVWGNGDHWKKVRRFSLQTMRDFGVGKKSLEEIILDEARLLGEGLASKEGQPISDVKHMMTLSISNVIHHIVFGFRYPHDDKTFLKVIKLLDDIFKNSGAVTGSLPKWCQFGKLKSRVETSKKALDLLGEYIANQITEHENTYDENNIRDFIDLYIQAQHAEERIEGNDTGTVHHLFRVILDLFSAGTETTGTSLDWALLYMIGYPEIQQKCFTEIEKVVGLGREVRLSDKSSLPYVEATLLEVLRISNIASMSLPHMATADVHISGHMIPKNAIVFGFLTTSHLDPTHFPEPYIFRPDRFLDDVTATVQYQDRFIPFSVGPRACPGESLAKTEMFLVFCNLIQKFRFSKVSEDDVLNYSGTTGVTTCADPYRLRVNLRHQ